MLKTGRVIKSTGSWYSVVEGDGQIFQCRLRGNYRIRGIRTTNPVAVGDLVDFQVEKIENQGVIYTIHDRHNFIIRKATKLSKASHIIAANLDVAILVATLDHPRTSTGFIDRFLVTAEAYHLPAAVIFNKSDLLTDEEKKQVSDLIELYQNLGYFSLDVSAATGYNLQQFSEFINNKISLVSGHSGVGKSALINAIDPVFQLRVGDISAWTNKGKHTTTYAEMLQLSQGGWIVDTPGIKEFGLYDFEKETLAQRFPEMRMRMSFCRFGNCTHIHEPDCAIKEALEKGEIRPFRYQNYLNMMNDNNYDN